MGQISLLSGNSGVGKSTLINCLLPDAHLRTAEISDAHNAGMHTTTFSEMLPLPEGGYVIDTPGIKGFGTFDIEREELGSYFKEIFRLSTTARIRTSRVAPCCKPCKTILWLKVVTNPTSICLKTKMRANTVKLSEKKLRPSIELFPAAGNGC